MQPASASLRKMKEEETTNKGIKNLLRFINKSLAMYDVKTMSQSYLVFLF